jgi:hypothetical protein
VSDAKGVVDERLDEQTKILGAPPCPTERITTERKNAPAYLCFFSYAPQKFIGNSSPYISMKAQEREKAKVVPSDEVIHRQPSWPWSCSSRCGGTLRGDGRSYEGVAQADAAADVRLYGGRGNDKGYARECQKK